MLNPRLKVLNQYCPIHLTILYDDLKQYDDAIAFYIKAINIGESRTEYYAARAALQIGMIHEKRGNKTQAIKFYEKCKWVRSPLRACRLPHSPPLVR